MRVYKQKIKTIQTTITLLHSAHHSTAYNHSVVERDSLMTGDYMHSVKTLIVPANSFRGKFKRWSILYESCYAPA